MAHNNEEDEQSIGSSAHDEETPQVDSNNDAASIRQVSLNRNPSEGTEPLQPSPSPRKIKSTEKQLPIREASTGIEVSLPKPSFNARSVSLGTASLSPPSRSASANLDVETGKMAAATANLKQNDEEDDDEEMGVKQHNRSEIVNQVLPPDLPPSATQQEQTGQKRHDKFAEKQRLGLKDEGESKINDAPNDIEENVEFNHLAQATPGAVAVGGTVTRSAPTVVVDSLVAPAAQISQRTTTTENGEENLIQAVLVESDRRESDESQVVEATVVNKCRTRAIIAGLLILAVAVTIAIVVPVTSRNSSPPTTANTAITPSPTPGNGFCGDGKQGNGTCAGGILCCSEAGFCGSTAEFCVNGQEIPNPDGFCGDGIVGNGTCEGGLCCSPFGFCGVTPAFCVDGQTPPPTFVGGPAVIVSLEGNPQVRAEIQSYDPPDDQDNDFDFSIEDDGDTLVLDDNTWVAVDLGPNFTMTRGTVLEFDFQSPIEGEGHFIFFDNDLVSSTDGENENSFRFQLYGTESVRRINSAFANSYAEVAPEVQHYVIPVGQFYTGRDPYLVFASTQDVLLRAQSRFSNIQVYERELTGLEIDFDEVVLERFDPGGQDIDNNADPVNNGNGLLLRDNTWTAINLGDDFVLTNDTLIEFDFQSTEQGEIHAIFLNTNLETTDDNGRVNFWLYGTQSTSERSPFRNYNEVAPEVRHYVIPAGQFFTGLNPYLVFVSDQDMAGGSARSLFSNVAIYRSFVSWVDFSSPGAILSYEPGGQDLDNNFTIEGNGATLALAGNTWVAVDLGPDFTINENTVLEFDFQSSFQSEIQFIFLDTDLVHVTDGNDEDKFRFQLYGTQIITDSISTYENYAEFAPASRHYVIPVGQFYTGPRRYLVFSNDLDDGGPGQSRFSNVFVYESRGSA